VNATAPKTLVAIESPSEQQLLLWIQTQVDRSVLEEIAANDRGNDTAKHLASIQNQLRPNPSMGLLPYWPLEVLQLEQYSEPDPSAKRGQLKRLLACTVLVRNGAHILSYDKYSDEEDFLETLAGALVQLTHSALALDVQAGETNKSDTE
jgi:hypothetical protein